MPRFNLHATALVAGRHGLLVTGPSGSGKTTLALTLLDLCRSRAIFACFVADDRVWLRAAHGRLLALAPATIAGLAEIRGFGPAELPHERATVIDGVVELVERNGAPRFREAASREFLGLSLPRLDLAEGDAAGAARAVLAWLEAGGPN